MTPLHQAALAYAARRVPVFPLIPDTKQPACPHSFKDATTDPTLINMWWSDVDYNIGTEPAASGLTVVDVDNKKGHQGSKSWAALCPEAPETLMVRTPSGGVHIYFTGTMRPSVGKLGDGLDIRSEDSYVLLPPSSIAGVKYEIITNHPPAPLPPQITKRSQKSLIVAVAPKDVVSDTDEIVEWASTLIAAMIKQDGPAAIGSALNQRTLELAMRLGDGPQYGYTLSEAGALAVMQAEWSQADRIVETISNAYKSRENPLGCGQIGSASRKYDPIFGVRPLELPDLTVEEHKPHTRLRSGDSFTMEPIRWIWPGWLAQGKLHILGGQKGAGKSTIAFSLLSEIVQGGTWPDGTHAPAGDVLIWSGEDDIKDTILPRISAVAGGKLDRVHFPDILRNWDGTNRHFDPSTDFPGLLHAARSLPALKVILIDPIVSAVAGDSHNNAETRRGLQPIVDFAEETGAAIIGITHFTKNTQGRDPIDRITGSLAFGAVPRVVWGASKGEDEAAPRRLVRISSNIGPNGGGFEYTLQQVPLAATGSTAQRIIWGNRLVGSAIELIEGSEGGGKGLKAVALLEYLLRPAGTAGVRVTDLKVAAEDQDISWETVKRAKAKMGTVRVFQPIGAGPHPGSWWRIDEAT